MVWNNNTFLIVLVTGINNLCEWKIYRLKEPGKGIINVNTLRTGDADLRFYITTVQDR